MIINIRGTSGSGKSHLAREIMKQYEATMPYYVTGRKQPIGYRLMKNGRKDLAVIGHYQTDCGGCDTIHDMNEIFKLVRASHNAGCDVLFEGLLISAEVNRTAQLHLDGLPLIVVALSLPLEECLASVESRRAAKAERTGGGPRPPLNPKNTESKHKGTMQSSARLEAQGVEVHRCDREAAFNLISNRLTLGL